MIYRPEAWLYVESRVKQGFYGPGPLRASKSRRKLTS